MPVELTSRREVAALLRAAGVHPSKRLGQNFLVDRRLLDTIIDQVRQVNGQEILEIGAGLGTVTRELAKVASRVIAVEVDRRLAEVLYHTVGSLPNVTVVGDDILTLDLGRVSTSGALFVVGNIPYRITAPILKRLVEERGRITGALLLTQAEVAEKIARSPGPQGSTLGILVQAYAEVEMSAHVSRRSFYPAPEVDSTLWKLSFLPSPRFTADEKKFFAVVRAVYGKRRKMIRAALRDIIPQARINGLLTEARVDPTSRGETLSLEEMDRLAGLM